MSFGSNNSSSISSRNDKKLCKKGCGHPVAPMTTRKGNPYDTCCKSCPINTTLHDPACEERYHQYTNRNSNTEIAITTLTTVTTTVIAHFHSATTIILTVADSVWHLVTVD